MKLRDLLALIYSTYKDNDTGLPYLCGGIARSKAMHALGVSQDINKIEDLDITTGDDTIHVLAKEFANRMGQNYKVDVKTGADQHVSVNIRNFKIDFSSNFINPNIEMILGQMGIDHPTDMDKEMFSRDFTCNALLLTLDMKKLKDPTHHGFDDIKQKIIRTCLKPEITLSANTNRIIRSIYFAAKLDFDLDKSIIEWIQKNGKLVNHSSEGYLQSMLEKSMAFNPDKTRFLLKQTGLEHFIMPPAPVKQAQYFRRNFDYGSDEELFSNLDKYKSVSDYRKKRRKKRKKIIKKILDSKLK